MLLLDLLVQHFVHLGKLLLKANLRDLCFAEFLRRAEMADLNKCPQMKPLDFKVGVLNKTICSSELRTHKNRTRDPWETVETLLFRNLT